MTIFRTRRLRLAGAVALLGAGALAMTACANGATSAPTATASATAGYPVTVSSCGVDYRYERAPSRVLLGAPGVVRTLEALGVADTAIGYALSVQDEGEAAAHPGLTAITSDWTPSKEFLIGAQPDLVIANDEQQFTGDGAASIADVTALGAGLYVLGDYCVGAPATTSIDAVYDDVDKLGAIFGVGQRAEQVVGSLRDRVAAAAALRGDRTLTAASVSIVDGTVYALTGAGYQAVLDAIGIENVFAGAGANYTQISREDVIATDPDVIFVVSSGDGADALAQARELFAGSAAVAAGKVFGQNENAYQAGGVRIVDVVERAAHDAYVG